MISILDKLLTLSGFRQPRRAPSSRIFDFREPLDGHWAEVVEQTGPYLRVRGMTRQGVVPRAGDVVWLPSETWPQGRRLPIAKVEDLRPSGAFVCLVSFEL